MEHLADSFHCAENLGACREGFLHLLEQRIQRGAVAHRVPDALARHKQGRATGTLGRMFRARSHWRESRIAILRDRLEQPCGATDRKHAADELRDSRRQTSAVARACAPLDPVRIPGAHDRGSVCPHQGLQTAAAFAIPVRSRSVEHGIGDSSRGSGAGVQVPHEIVPTVVSVLRFVLRAGEAIQSANWARSSPGVRATSCKLARAVAGLTATSHPNVSKKIFFVSVVSRMLTPMTVASPRW